MHSTLIPVAAHSGIVGYHLLLTRINLCLFGSPDLTVVLVRLFLSGHDLLRWTSVVCRRSMNITSAASVFFSSGEMMAIDRRRERTGPPSFVFNTRQKAAPASSCPSRDALIIAEPLLCCLPLATSIQSDKHQKPGGAAVSCRLPLQCCLVGSASPLCLSTC